MVERRWCRGKGEGESTAKAKPKSPREDAKNAKAREEKAKERPILRRPASYSSIYDSPEMLGFWGGGSVEQCGERSGALFEQDIGLGGRSGALFEQDIGLGGRSELTVCSVCFWESGALERCTRKISCWVGARERCTSKISCWVGARERVFEGLGWIIRWFRVGTKSGRG